MHDPAGKEKVLRDFFLVYICAIKFTLIMFAVFGFMAAGVISGWLLRRYRLKWMGKVTMVLIWILLFLLGLEVGGDRSIVESLPTLGVEAVIIAVVSVLGSCLLALLLWRWVRRDEGNKEKSEGYEG